MQIKIVLKTRVPADAAPQRKLLTGGRVSHLERALPTLQFRSPGSHWATGVLLLGVECGVHVVADAAEVRGAEAEEHRHRAAIPALKVNIFVKIKKIKD